MGYFVMKRVDDGFLFRLVGTNQLIVGTSQIYISSNACKKGILSVIMNAEEAGLENRARTQNQNGKVPNPKFILSGNDQSLFRFFLCGPRGEVILSSQAYATEELALSGIRQIRASAPGAEGFEEDEGGQLIPLNLSPSVTEGEQVTDVGEISIYTDRPLQVDEDKESGGVFDLPAEKAEGTTPAGPTDGEAGTPVSVGKKLYPDLFV